MATQEVSLGGPGSTIMEALSVLVTHLQAGRGIPKSVDEAQLNSVVEFADKVLQLTEHAKPLPSPISSEIAIVAQSTAFRNLLDNPVKPDLLISLCKDGNQQLSVEEACYALDGILSAGDLVSYRVHVEKLAGQLCDAWLAAEGAFSPPSSCLSLEATLMSSSLIQVLKLWHGSGLGASNELLGVKIPLVLFQIWFQILQLQNEDGSWGIEGCNPAYPIITLTRLRSMALLDELDSKVQAAISNGKSHINLCDDLFGAVEKSYLLIATETSLTSSRWKLPSSAIPANIPEKKLTKFCAFFSQLPCAKGIEQWRLKAAMTEGFLFLPLLMQNRIAMFDREGMKEDEYLPFIAFTFTCANNLQPFHVCSNILLDMMVLTLRAYQLDEFVENVIGKHFGDSPEIIKALIRGIFEDESSIGEKFGKEDEATVLKVHTTLSAFRDSILLHPSVIASSEYDRNLLKNELREYLVAHITQLEDSRRFYEDKTVPFGSYNTWVRTSGATHVFVAFSLAYLHCLDPNCRSSIRSAEISYVIQDVWLHLGKKVRMENDHPSLARDREEHNLNSLDFPEFGPDNAEGIDSARQALIRIIRYEKRRCGEALNALEELAGSSDPNLQMLRFYFFLTDVVGDVYAVRDISSGISK
ncbi:hypothetical protein V8C42DRAFT_339817 [Trichoderma barbatum]